MYTLSKGTVKKVVLNGFKNRTIETRKGNSYSKETKTGSRINNTMSRFPRKINNRTIEIKETKLMPSILPTQVFKGGLKLKNTMRGDNMLRQQKLVTTLAREIINGRDEMQEA